jgi:hypothetical protein
MSDFTDLIRACDERVRLGPGEYPASDYPWGIKKVSGVDELIEAFRHGNWSVRTGFVLDDLAFVEQISGGDEWLALKLDGGKWKTFESVSFGRILERRGEEHVREYIKHLLKTPWYEMKYPQGQSSAMAMGGITL